jgi:polyisoprenoid-binding protein YceI
MLAHHLLVMSCFLGGAALAAGEKKAAPKFYQVDTKASKVFVKVGSATRLGHAHGVEGRVKSGKLTLGRAPGRDAGSGTLVFDMASFTADTPEARKRVGLEKKHMSSNEAKKVTAAMRGRDVLDVERYPTATFDVTTVTPLDKQAPGQPGTYQLEGKFTLHGKEQPLKITAKVDRGRKGALKMTGSFTIRQTDYGITPTTALGGLAKVADELEISADLVLKAEEDR